MKKTNKSLKMSLEMRPLTHGDMVTYEDEVISGHEDDSFKLGYAVSGRILKWALSNDIVTITPAIDVDGIDDAPATAVRWAASIIADEIQAVMSVPLD